jgi:hypothetical protein
LIEIGLELSDPRKLHAQFTLCRLKFLAESIDYVDGCALAWFAAGARPAAWAFGRLGASFGLPLAHTQRSASMAPRVPT